MGVLGSFAASPRLGLIGLALLRREAEPGRSRGAVVELPRRWAAAMRDRVAAAT